MRLFAESYISQTSNTIAWSDIENFMEGDRILEVAKKFLAGEIKE
jgi:hypothetical protein